MAIIKITERQRDEKLSKGNNLFEERGINFTDVVPEVNRIAKSICDKLSKEDIIIGYNFGNGKPYWQKEYDYSIFGFPIKVSAKKYQIRRSDIRKDVDKNNFYSNLTTNIGDKTLYINIVVINGKMDRSRFMRDLQHEIQHYYDNMMSGHNWNVSSLYEYGRKLMQSNDKFTKCIGQLFYLSDKDERMAFAHGLYQYMLHSRSKTKDGFIKDYYNSNEHIFLEHLRLLSDTIESEKLTNNHRHTLRIVFSETGITNMKQLRKLLNDVMDDYERRLCRSYSVAYEHKGFNCIKEREETFYTPRFTKL